LKYYLEGLSQIVSTGGWHGMTGISPKKAVGRILPRKSALARKLYIAKLQRDPLDKLNFLSHFYGLFW
jgi:hypothetical protein